MAQALELDGVEQIEIEKLTNTFKIFGETDTAVCEQSVQVQRNQFDGLIDVNEDKLTAGESGVVSVKVLKTILCELCIPTQKDINKEV